MTYWNDTDVKFRWVRHMDKLTVAQVKAATRHIPCTGRLRHRLTTDVLPTTNYHTQPKHGLQEQRFIIQRNTYLPTYLPNQPHEAQTFLRS
jgi:hypothetical protein